MLSKTRLAKIERSWRTIVFGRTALRLLLAWLGASAFAMFATAMPQLQSVSTSALRVLFPAGFVFFVWGTAISYILTAALSFVRRDLAGGLWMLLWALLLTYLGATGVRYLLVG